MTRRQREALKLAMEALRRIERDTYSQWDLAKQKSSGYTPAELAKVQQRYFDTTRAMQTIEEMLRGEQGVMEI